MNINAKKPTIRQKVFLRLFTIFNTLLECALFEKVHLMLCFHNNKKDQNC